MNDSIWSSIRSKFSYKHDISRLVPHGFDRQPHVRSESCWLDNCLPMEQQWATRCVSASLIVPLKHTHTHTLLDFSPDWLLWGFLRDLKTRKHKYLILPLTWEESADLVLTYFVHQCSGCWYFRSAEMPLFWMYTNCQKLWSEHSSTGGNWWWWKCCRFNLFVLSSLIIFDVPYNLLPHTVYDVYSSRVTYFLRQFCLNIFRSLRGKSTTVWYKKGNG